MMLVTRYKNPIQNRDRRFDLLSEFFNTFQAMEQEEPQEVFDFVPTVNTREDKDAYHIEVDVPGVKKEDVDISIDKNLLTIKGKREVREEVQEDDYYRVESRYGTFSRSFTLPEKVDVDNIKAHSEDGVLEITIPKLNVVTDTTKKIVIE